MALATRPKKTTHTKKRRAQHHRHSKVYLKTYWPYLPMLMIVGFGIVINSIWSNQAVLGAFSDFSSQTLLQETNKKRADEKQSPLSLDSRLTLAAQAKAEDMARRNYWSHVSPDGRAPWALLTENGYQYQTAGENLAYGFTDSAATISGWMSSEEHRANILNAAYKHVGFGIAQSPNFQGRGPETIIVAEYGQPAGDTLGAQDQNSQNLDLAAKNVARIDILTGGQAVWSGLVVGMITGGAAVLFVLRHGFRLKRLLNEGEAFVAEHPYIDIAIVLIITLGFLLTRPGGLIH